jgi:hypothetical protein
VTDTPLGFVALRSLRKGSQDPAQALAEIRRIYFKTTRRTIEHDLAHAIELLKSIESEGERDKAAVYMDGLSQMRSEWAAAKPAGQERGPGKRASNKRQPRKTRPGGQDRT